MANLLAATSFSVFTAYLIIYVSIATDDYLHLLIIGDWGGIPSSPFTTPAQLSTRNIMESIASIYNITNIISLGDNFYADGVQNTHDSRFTYTFENVYNTPYLSNIPWFVIAGNHDWHGNVSAQIEYSKHSNLWNMPYFYYNKLFNIPNSNQTLELVLLDTYILCGFVENQLITNECNPPNITAANLQYLWLEKTLNTSNATYIIVGGHLTIYSYGFHGPQQQLITNLNSLLLKYDNVITYIAAHDHNLQFIEIQTQTLQYVISGAANGCRTVTPYLNSTYNPDHTQSFKYNGCNQGGFVRLSINNNFAKMYFYEGVDSSITFETGKWLPNHVYYTIDQLKSTSSPSVQLPLSPSPTDFPTTVPITGVPTTLTPTTLPITAVPTFAPSLITMMPSTYPTGNEYETSVVLLMISKFYETEIYSSEFHDKINKFDVMDFWARVLIIFGIVLVSICIIAVLITIYICQKSGYINLNQNLSKTHIALASLKKEYVRDDSAEDTDEDGVNDTLTMNCDSDQNDSIR